MKKYQYFLKLFRNNPYFLFTKIDTGILEKITDKIKKQRKKTEVKISNYFENRIIREYFTHSFLLYQKYL